MSEPSPSRMVRNFIKLNGFPPLPARSWMKCTGLPMNIAVAHAISAYRHIQTGIAAATRRMSRSRFTG